MRKLSLLLCFIASAAFAQSDTQNNPTWWDKFDYLFHNGPMASAGATSSSNAGGGNVDVSNECGPQSETYITLNAANPKNLAGGSNEIFRLPMRGYASTDGGKSWTGTDLPLPPPIGANGIDFGSDPSLAFDANNNLYYSYIVVFFSNGNGINGTEMAVAKSTDGGKTYPTVTFFSYDGGQNHFNDKPMITTDTNPKSPFRGNVYVAWDAASGGSTSAGLRVATSRDGGATFTVTRADDPQGQGRLIGAVPFVGTNGELYVAWNDWNANTIAFNRSLDGGATWSAQSVIAKKTIPLAIAVPAEKYRGALVYPSCDTDRSTGPHRGRLACSWMDLTSAGVTDIFTSFSDDKGSTWSAPRPATDQFAFAVDRFNHWLSIDQTNGVINVSFYDTRNDSTGFRYIADTYLSRSSDGANFGANVRVSNVSSNEHDCNGLFPCSAINYGNQQGDYEGLVAWGGIAHPIWTDSRFNQNTVNGCSAPLMEEVFSASVK